MRRGPLGSGNVTRNGRLGGGPECRRQFANFLSVSSNIARVISARQRMSIRLWRTPCSWFCEQSASSCSLSLSTSLSKDSHGWGGCMTEIPLYSISSQFVAAQSNGAQLNSLCPRRLQIVGAFKDESNLHSVSAGIKGHNAFEKPLTTLPGCKRG